MTLVTCLMIFIALVSGTGSAQPQKSPDLAGCKTTNDQTTCNLYWLRKSIEEAHTVKAEY
jgi:hypothetical protein